MALRKMRFNKFLKTGGEKQLCVCKKVRERERAREGEGERERRRKRKDARERA